MRIMNDNTERRVLASELALAPHYRQGFKRAFLLNLQHNMLHRPDSAST